MVLAGLSAIVVAAWLGAYSLQADPGSGAFLWGVRQEALHLSGMLSIALMSLGMVLSLRLDSMRRLFGGMDRVYKTHQWAGILAVGFAACHWLIELSDDLIKAMFGKAGRPPKGGGFEFLRELAEDLGEPALYLLLAMLIITLWRRHAYRMWRFLHRGLSVVYLLLAFHAVVLAPSRYWTQPAGVLLAVCVGIGSVASVVSLFRWIRRGRSMHMSAPSLNRRGGVGET